jgi:hypothetical protein
MRPCPGGDSKVALHDSGRTKETIGLFSGSLNVSAKAERLRAASKQKRVRWILINIENIFNRRIFKHIFFLQLPFPLRWCTLHLPAPSLKKPAEAKKLKRPTT